MVAGPVHRVEAILASSASKALYEAMTKARIVTNAGAGRVRVGITIKDLQQALNADAVSEEQREWLQDREDLIRHFLDEEGADLSLALGLLPPASSIERVGFYYSSVLSAYRMVVNTRTVDLLVEYGWGRDAMAALAASLKELSESLPAGELMTSVSVKKMIRCLQVKCAVLDSQASTPSSSLEASHSKKRKLAEEEYGVNLYKENTLLIPAVTEDYFLFGYFDLKSGIDSDDGIVRGQKLGFYIYHTWEAYNLTGGKDFEQCFHWGLKGATGAVVSEMSAGPTVGRPGAISFLAKAISGRKCTAVVFSHGEGAATTGLVRVQVYIARREICDADPTALQSHYRDDTANRVSMTSGAAYGPYGICRDLRRLCRVTLPHLEETHNVHQTFQSTAGRAQVAHQLYHLLQSESVGAHEPPPGLACTLREYQLRALRFMVGRETGRDRHPAQEAFWLEDHPLYVTGGMFNRQPFAMEESRGGLLCSQMGLGKTVLILALILSQPRPFGLGISPDAPPAFIDFASRNQVATRTSVVKTSAIERKKGNTLILVPHMLVTQWATEVARHTPRLKCILFDDHFHLAGDAWTCPPSIWSETLPGYDIVIASHDALSSPSSRMVLLSIDWFRVCIDEAHLLSTQGVNRWNGVFALSAHKRWAVTGIIVVALF
jgi:hypothetical protein